MELQLVRDTYTRQSTTGRLSIDGTFFCYTLEDVVRPVKIPKETAIPAGHYGIELYSAPKFGPNTPLLQNVPGFTAILIHNGNYHHETSGCILVGNARSADFVANSRDTFKRLRERLVAASATEALSIRITESGQPSRSAGSFAEGSRVRVRSDIASIGSGQTAPVLVLQGSELQVAARSVAGASVRVTGVMDEGRGAAIAGLINANALEAVPLGPGDDAGGSGEWRVDASTLHLRSAPDTTDDGNILASLPRGHLVRKLGVAEPMPWWNVRAIVGTSPLDGVVHSGFLRAAGQIPPSSGRPSREADRVQLSEKALTLIVKAEGMDQPSRWPGGESGITLGIGYDLGYVTQDRFRGDWADELTEAELTTLSTAIGLRSDAARRAARNYAGITISRSSAEAVFQRASVPKMCADAARAFPGILALPIDAQGALISLVFNRGTDMGRPGAPGSGPDRRAEMRVIRDAIADTRMDMDSKLRLIRDALLGMRRIWEGKGLAGLIQRRTDEAALVESCRT